MTPLEKIKIVMKYSDKILALVDEAQQQKLNIPRGDLQAMTEAIIIGAIAEAITK